MRIDMNNTNTMDSIRKMELARINRAALISHFVIDLLIFGAYILEYVKGSRTIGYVVTISLFALFPVAVEFVIFKINKSSSIIGYMMGICYSIMYAYILLTTTSELSFIYIVPMYMVVILYSNVLFCAAMSSAGLLSNVAFVVIQGMNPEVTLNIADIEIRLISMAMAGVLMVISCRIVKSLNNGKLKSINEQKEKTDLLLNQIINTSDHMVMGIATAADDMEELGGSIGNIHRAIGEVNIGNTEIANAIQQQQHRTEQISNNIAQVRETAEYIDTNMESATQLMTEGQKQMEKLKEQAMDSLNSSEIANEKVRDLGTQTGKMNSITDMISGITHQTAILSINARIEAARAGEAGKGFAVVAGEISSLATQTQSATMEINELIDSITIGLNEVSKAITLVDEKNHSNRRISGEAMESFVKIMESSQEIASQAQDMRLTVEELNTANSDIVANIETISAITQEVTAHSSETYNACGENSRMVDKVLKIVRELNSNAQDLKQFIKH